MYKFTYLGGTAYCRRALESRTGVVEMGYGGLIDRMTFHHLRLDLLRVGGLAPAAVIRFDRAMVLLDEVPLLRGPPVPLRPAAFVVPRAQRDMWIEYGRKLAEVGVTRVVFLETQIALAFEWAERYSLVTASI